MMAHDVDVREMLELQLSEIEMLKSMFPDTNEFFLDDENAINEIKTYLDNQIEYELLSARLGFTLNLKLCEGKVPVEVVCHLPHEYPQVPPEVFLRAPILSRSQHRTLSDTLQALITDDLEKGELYLCSIIQWLQDNNEDYLKVTENSSANSDTESKSKDTKFSRMWIYSHHIYSKIKRKDILEFSKELNLTGFCMPGKPGMICIEGYNNHVEEFWHRIRRMQWKRLVMKEKEDEDLEDKTVDSFRKFGVLEEMHFEPRQAKGRGSHADRGLLFQFLEERGFANIFPIYFGVEGKVGDDSD